MRPQSALASDEEAEEEPDLENTPSPKKTQGKGKRRARRVTDELEVDDGEAEPSQAQPTQRSRRSTRRGD